MKNQTKPLIGFACSYNQKEKYIFVNKTYFDAILCSGGIPVSLPYVDNDGHAAEALSNLDGIVFAGGVDVNPSLYGEAVDEKCGEICDIRDISEGFYVKAAINTKLPVLGIYRGIQAINVFLGGSLYQDIPSQVENCINHQKGATHEITVAPESLLYEIMGYGKITVNSYHHQAIKNMAKGLVPVAVSDDGIIEAVEFEGRKNSLAVQYHPEVSFESDECSKRLFSWFVKECENFKNSR